GEGCGNEPAAVPQLPRQVDRLPEGVGIYKAAACDRSGAYAVAVVDAARREDIETLHHRGRIGGAPPIPAWHPKQRHRLADSGQIRAIIARGDTPVSRAASLLSPALKDPEIERFQARVYTGRRRRAKRQTDGGAGQSVFECSKFFCRR